MGVRHDAGHGGLRAREGRKRPSMAPPCLKKINKPVLVRVDEFCSAAVQAGNPIVPSTLETTHWATRRRLQEAGMASKMFKTVGRVAAGVAALSLVAAATTASADSRHHRHKRDKGGDVAAAAITAGVIGLVIGAAIADDDHRDDRYRDRRYAPPPPPPPPRYGQGYGYGYDHDYAPRPYYGDRECWTTREYNRRSGSYYERTVCR
ncbi:hypothetical protein CA606_00050 [Caulobacter vibrioides]|uniref:Uncharacterized protein n=2 Tax=Caulobacter vibrioides TaxID=155892 RepID=A0A290MM28_CAUVI|nr:hypothetical protein CA606_00050 [Caulobacter vibrioides]